MNILKSLENRVRGWFPKEPNLSGNQTKVAENSKVPTANINFRARGIITLIIGFAIFIVGVALHFSLNAEPTFLSVVLGFSVPFFFIGCLLLRAHNRVKKGKSPLKQQLTKKAIDHQINQEPEPRLYRYRKIAIIAIAIMIVVFPVATNLLPQYTAHVVVALIIVHLVAGTVLIAGLTSSIGKKMILLVIVLFLIGIVASLLLRTFNIPLGG